MLKLAVRRTPLLATFVLVLAFATNSYIPVQVTARLSHVTSLDSNDMVTLSEKRDAAWFSPEDPDLALVILSTEDVGTMKDSIRHVQRAGGIVFHVFPTHVLVAKVPRSLQDVLTRATGVEQVIYSVVDPSIVERYGEMAEMAVEAWNDNFKMQGHTKGLEPSLQIKDPPAIIGDMLIEARSHVGLGRTSPALPYNAGFYDTSEYMIGDVSVAILLPESNGTIDPNKENWASNDVSAVVSEIQAGLSWWAAREPKAHLSFTYSISVVETSYEPITRGSYDEGLWIGETMRKKGYSSSNYFDQVRSYLNDLRSNDGTDWTVAIFVANSKADLDGYFANGKFAYAYLGGPFMVMTYDNNGYSLFNMDAVTTHELGHIFYALDEYYDAKQLPSARSGYLNFENLNTEYGGTSNVPCIMRGQISPYASGSVCYYTRGQIGWIDSDGDGILDIVDFPPSNSLNPYSPDPVAYPIRKYVGQASSRACYPNNNPHSLSQNNITINTIKKVQYWVEDVGGNIIKESVDALSSDGMFDSDLEDYVFRICPELAPGTYRFASVAWSTNGIGQISYDNLTVRRNWESSTVYVEAATDKLRSGISWFEVNDSSSLSGIVLEATVFSHIDGILFGPYITNEWSGESMIGKPYIATFRLKVSSNTLHNNVLYIDIGYNGGHVLQSKVLKANDFASSSVWQDFQLSFTVPLSLNLACALEFRLKNLNTGITDAYADYIAISRGWNDSTVYFESAYNKRVFSSSWSPTNDVSSFSGLVMRASASSSNGGCLFGPYITVGWDGQSMLSKPYRAFFRLRTTDNTSQSSIAHIDVCYNVGTVIQSMTIKANDFTSNSWQDFQLTFVSPNSVTAGLEFRIINLNNGVADIFADWIVVQKEYDPSTCYIEAAYNKQQSGGSWSRINDQTSYSGLVMKAQATSPNGGCLYGPYITTDWSGQTMLGKPFTTTFRLKTSSIFSSSDLVNIDICYNAGTVLQLVTIKANDFATLNTWQDFNIGFIVPKSVTRGLEFRVKNLNNGLADIYVDCISVERPLNTSGVYVEAAYGKQVTGSSWSQVIDSSSFSGTVMKASGSSSSGAWLYGPYIRQDSQGGSMLGKPYTANLRLKVSSNASPNNVAYIDVCCNASATIIQSRTLEASDFSSPNTWQDFQLNFVTPNTMTAGLEFRVTNLNNGVADLSVDYVSVSPRWNASTAYAEGAYNKQRSGSSWSNVNDPSSWSGIVMKAAASSPNSGCLYGPYISSDWDARSMLGKSYVVSFRLKVSSNLATDNVVRVDVCYNAGTVLQLMIIKANDFTSSNTWQDFQLAFTTPSYLTYGLEFRVVNLNNGVTDVFADQLLVNSIE
jgi:hypothetical protein